MATAWARVRVVCPTGAVDVSLPLVRTVADLVEELVTSVVPGAPLAGAGPWHLHRLGAPPLPPSSPLAAAHPTDGEVLHLSSGPPVPAAVAVDDALTALASGAAATGRWGTPSATGALGAAALVLATGAGLVALGAGRGGLLPLGVLGALGLLGVALLVAARVLRRDGGDVVALASLPVWACAGLALATSHAGGATGGPAAALGQHGVLDVVLAAAGLALGALGALAAVPARAPWWAATATTGVLLAAGGALVVTGALPLVQAAAVVGTVLVALVGALPHLLARSALWSSDAPTGRALGELMARGRAARALLSALAAGTAAVVGLCGVLLELRAPLDGVALGLVLAAVVGLRARRSRFVVESAALLAAGAAPAGAALARLAVTGPAPDRRPVLVLALVVLALALVLALLVVVRRAARGAAGAAQRLTRPRVRRALDVAEAALALAVLPLLGWVLGVYTTAADAGARW